MMLRERRLGSMDESVVKIIFMRDKTTIEMESGTKIDFSAYLMDGRKMTLDEFRNIYFNIALGKIWIGEYDD